MSAELNSAQRIVDLIREIEKVTGETHYDLTSAVQALKNGYGQGGDSKFKELLSGTLTEITDVDLKDVTVIRQNQFYGTTSISKVSIPDNVVEIGQSAFYNCSGIEYLKIPISTKINNASFTNVVNIKDVIFSVGTGITPSYVSIAEAKRTPWYLSSKNIVELTIPEGVTQIGNYMFYSLSALTKISMASTIIEIGKYAFSGCAALTSIALPSELTSIGDWAFQNCSRMTKIFIPKTVASINEMAFYGCSDLTDVYYEGTEEEWNAISRGSQGIGNVDYDTVTKHYNSTGLPEE